MPRLGPEPGPLDPESSALTMSPLGHVINHSMTQFYRLPWPDIGFDDFFACLLTSTGFRSIKLNRQSPATDLFRATLNQTITPEKVPLFLG